MRATMQWLEIIHKPAKIDNPAAGIFAIPTVPAVSTQAIFKFQELLPTTNYQKNLQFTELTSLL